MPPTQAMYAFLMEHPDERDFEGIPAMIGPGGMAMPMVGSDMSRAGMLKPIAKIMADAQGKPIRLVKFTNREELEVFTPDPEAMEEAKAQLMGFDQAAKESPPGQHAPGCPIGAMEAAAEAGIDISEVKSISPGDIFDMMELMGDPFEQAIAAAFKAADMNAHAMETKTFTQTMRLLGAFGDIFVKYAKKVWAGQ